MLIIILIALLLIITTVGGVENMKLIELGNQTSKPKNAIIGTPEQLKEYRDSKDVPGSIPLTYYLHTPNWFTAAFLDIKLKAWNQVPIAVEESAALDKVDYIRLNQWRGVYSKKLSHTKCTLKNLVDPASIPFCDKSKIHDYVNLTLPNMTIPEYELQNPEGVHIVKPVGVGACGGRGIYIVKKPSEIKSSGKFIVQKYIDNPATFRNKKFHVRAYLMVKTWGRPSLLSKGEIFTAAQPYRKGCYWNKDIHDTHYGSTNECIIFPDDVGDIYNNAFAKVKAELESLDVHVRCYSESKNAYEILGIDIMFETDCTPWIIEINNKVGFDLDNMDINEKSYTFWKLFCDWEYSAISEVFQPSGGGVKSYLMHDPNYIITGHLKKFMSKYAEININRLPSYVDYLRHAQWYGNYNKKLYHIRCQVKNLVDPKSLPMTDKSKLPSLIGHTKKNLDIRSLKPGVYIHKPVGSGAMSGTGITVFTDTKAVHQLENEAKNPQWHWIVQEYIQPMLFRDKKFHVRMYIMVRSWARSTVFSKGEILTAAKPYIAGDYGNKAIHDTHWGSTLEAIVFPDDLPESSQKKIMPKLDGLLKEFDFPPVKAYSESKFGYEILGADVMFENDGTPWVLEINAKIGMDPDMCEDNAFWREFAEWEFKNGISPKL